MQFIRIDTEANREMKSNFLDDLNKEVIGVDEVGRGSWSGPLVACATLLNKKILGESVLTEIKDSKRLNKEKRKTLSKVIKINSIFSFGIISAKQIDKIGIQNATESAIKISLRKFESLKNKIRIDGRKFFSIQKKSHEFLVKGDQKSVTIASASILAKVFRDNIMEVLSKKFKGYDWENNAGYGTPKHIIGLKKYGVSDEHRKSFKPILKILDG